jgi:hypothetical protein
MQPQSPNHPAPPEPGSTPHVPVPPANDANPHSYTAPEFGKNQGPPTPQNQDYRFIFESNNTPKKISFNASSLMTKVILYSVGAFLLLFVIVIIKSALSGAPSNISAIDLVMEDQQEIVHLSQEAYSQQGTTQPTQNSSATLQAAATSAQNALLAYLHKIGVKINTSILTNLESKVTDTELTNAAASGLYDQTYDSVMKQQLSTYALNLKQAYNLTTGTNGKAILSSQYLGAKLLYEQLVSPTS